MLVRHEPYREVGATYGDWLRQSQSVEHLTQHLESLGYEVHLALRLAAASKIFKGIRWHVDIAPTLPESGHRDHVANAMIEADILYEEV